jgi:replicative DNA helicase
MKQNYNDRPERRAPAPLEPVPGRVPPSDLDAEAAVLSACLLDPSVVDLVREIIQPADMYADSNRRILEVIYALQDSQKKVDIVAVAGSLRDTGRLDQIGGTPYLAQLADATPSVANVEDHAHRVKDKSKTRAMISVCQQIAADGYGDTGPTAQWLEQAEKDVATTASDEREQGGSSALYGEVARKAYRIVYESAKSGATMVGYPTGFDELDNHVGGLADGDLWIVGGYPGAGKTSWVEQAVENVALINSKTEEGKEPEARICVALFTLEMKCEQLLMRALARRNEIPFSNLRVGRMQPKQWRQLSDDCKYNAPDVAMMLDEGADLTPHRMRRRLRRHLSELRHRFGKNAKYGAIVVDYIQLMKANNPNKNRAEEVGSISKELKSIGKEFKCAVIALSSLNRPDQKAKPKCPGMSALRESGALEFDADVIMMVHRDDAFKEKGEAPDHLADLVVVKGRNSGASRHEVQFDGRFTAFYPLGHRRFQEEGQPQQEISQW